MILDRLENAELYFSPKSPLRAGLDFLKKAVAENPSDGRHESADGIYATVQGYSTAPSPEKLPESHRRYIDIQAVFSGEEVIHWMPVDGMSAEIPYSDEKDIIFYRNAQNGSSLVLRPGLFAVFFPKDAHKPGCRLAGPVEVRKIVVKVPV
jgi:YhcH/YjgK/YiaL family protein